MIHRKIYLSEDQIPRQWLNITPYLSSSTLSGPCTGARQTGADGDDICNALLEQR